MDDDALSPPTASAGAGPDAERRTPKRAALSSWVGSSLEYYDFFIYGTAAALVFPKVFFPAGNPTVATIASLATFGVAYVARPFGAFLWGHLGDTIGRKRVLVMTLLGMGIATFLIGVLPSYATIGMAAPTLLLVLRVCQGVAVAGEQSSASTTTLEHAPPGRRAYFTSFTMAGTQAGNILATAAFLPIAALPESALLSWGWRIPFLLSAVVLLVAWWIRRSLHESPAFEREKANNAVPKAPLGVLFRHHWRDVVKVVLAALASVPTTLFGQFALVYGVQVGLSRGTFLYLAFVAYLIALAAIPLAGLLADRIGRRPVYAIGMIGTGALMYPFFWAISTQNVALIWLFGILMISLFYSCYLGAAFALWTEQFTTNVRTSGVAVGTQIGFAISGFAPAIAATLAGPGLANWTPVALLGIASTLVALLAVLTMRKKHGVDVADADGNRPSESERALA